MPTSNSSAMHSKKVSTSSDQSLLKRMTAESGVIDELLLVCGVIGTTTTSDGNSETIVPVTDCLNWLQDLQRALRRDDDTYRPISLLMCKWNIVPKKLLPLIMTCRYDTPMVLTIVKILVILTKPISESTKKAGRFAIDTKKYSEETIEEHKLLRENALLQSNMLMDLKRVITYHPSHTTSKGEGLLSVFVSLLAEPISKTGSGRSEMDHLTIELVLHLFRNLLAAEPLIKNSTDITQTHNNLHHDLVCLFESELVLDILLVIAQEMESRENQSYNLLLMELFNLLFKAQDPTAVARSASDSESATHSKSLKEQLSKEKQKLHQNITSSRHGNFGGTLMVKKADGTRTFRSANLSYSSQPIVKQRRNRKREAFVGSGRTLLTHSRLAPSTTPALLRSQKTIHDFCEKFLQHAYGPLMKSIKHEFRRDSVRLEEGDTAVFFRIIWFLAQWWRVSRKEELGHLIFTMDIFTFKLVMGSIDSYSQRKMYSPLSQATALYSEMLHMLHAMCSSKDCTENIMALGLMDTLFYGNEPLDKLPRLLSTWAPGTMTREYLCDLVEIVHLTLKLLEVSVPSSFQLDATQISSEIKAKKYNTIESMKANAADFDVNSYIIRKLISNHVVAMYTHLLSQYYLNSSHVNNRALSFLMRFSKLQLIVQDDSITEGPLFLLSAKTVTLEPMLFNIQLILVINQILNDKSLRNQKEYSQLLTYGARFMESFGSQAKENPLLYIESLFRHSLPHRFCDQLVNSYVVEELRMIAERDLLLEEEEKLIFKENQREKRKVETAFEASNDVTLASEVNVASSDNDDELEWEDFENKPTSGDVGPLKRRKRQVILSDSEDDNDNIEFPDES